MAPQVRLFPRDADSGPDYTLQASLAAEVEYYREWAGGRRSLTIKPFVRLDNQDGDRTHADLREFNWLMVEDDWELRIGIGKVFWGVTEARHLVDIVNQTDLVEDPDGDEKLGQPMVQLTLLRDWGALDLFVLPGFRERTFPSKNGRLGPGIPIRSGKFDSSLGRKHIDLAARWSHSLGEWDIGLSWFYGTSREPVLRLSTSNPYKPALVPYYDIINQAGLDLQWTRGAWLWKLEGIARGGQDGSFTALDAGFEYTRVGVFDTRADLGWLLEYLHDSRDEQEALTPFEDDIMVGVRWALNDQQGTRLLATLIQDRDSSGRVFNLEASRRLGQDWRINLEARFFNTSGDGQALFPRERDDYFQLELVRYF